MKFKIVFLIVPIILIIVFSNCKTDNREDNKKSTSEVLPVHDSIIKTIYVLPSPNEMLSEIFINGVKINTSLLNSYSNAEKYVETRSQAINLGVYITDFAYLSFSDATYTELDYLKVIKQLAENINMYGVVGNKIMNRIQKNLTSQDSLNKISNELYYKISNNLEFSHRENIFILISAGAIIESLYLSVSLVDNFEEYKEIIQRMYEQKSIFDNYYEYALAFKDDPYVKKILDQLEILKLTFDRIESDKTPQNIQKNEDNKLTFKGGEDFIVTSNNFEDFKKNIISIREEIINVNF